MARSLVSKVVGCAVLLAGVNAFSQSSPAGSAGQTPVPRAMVHRPDPVQTNSSASNALSGSPLFTNNNPSIGTNASIPVNPKPTPLQQK